MDQHKIDVPNLRVSDNSVGSSALPSTDQPLYTTEDIDRWKAGAENFRQCERALYAANENRGKRNVVLSESVEAMFLGEKPAVFMDSSISDHHTILEKYGVRSMGEYAYTIDGVQRVLDAHPTYFEHIRPSPTPDNVMLWLYQQPVNEAHIQRGLILGFPLKAVLDHQKLEGFPYHAIVHRMMGPDGNGGIFEETSDEYAFCLSAFCGSPALQLAPHEIITFMNQQCRQHANELGITIEDIPDILEGVEFMTQCTGMHAHGLNWVEHEPISEESIRKIKRSDAAMKLSGICRNTLQNLGEILANRKPSAAPSDTE